MLVFTFPKNLHTLPSPPLPYPYPIHSVLTAQIRRPHLRQARPAHQRAIRNHKVAIPSHNTLRLRIQPRQHDGNERRIRRLVLERQGRELRDPDGLVEGSVESRDIVRESGRLLCRAAAAPPVPVRDDEVDRAAAARVEERFEPGRAHERGGGVRVRDGGRAELHALAGEGLDVGVPSRDGGGDG